MTLPDLCDALTPRRRALLADLLMQLIAIHRLLAAKQRDGGTFKAAARRGARRHRRRGRSR
jgi:hypothetical protein